MDVGIDHARHERAVPEFDHLGAGALQQLLEFGPQPAEAGLQSAGLGDPVAALHGAPTTPDYRRCVTLRPERRCWAECHGRCRRSRCAEADHDAMVIGMNGETCIFFSG